MKIFIKIIIFASIVLLPFIIIDVRSQTQFEMNKNACDKYTAYYKKLTKILKQITDENKKDAIFLKKLKSSQIAWEKFRDSQIDLIFPKQKKQIEYGSVYPMCNCIQLSNLTIERIEQLKVWISGTEEGDVCAGSVKIK
jgi:uncharacterized protein YecT (DUF1311 family)